MDITNTIKVLDQCIDRFGVLRGYMERCGLRDDFNDGLTERCKAEIKRLQDEAQMDADEEKDSASRADPSGGD